MHVFAEDLKYSHDCEDLPYWREIYSKAFPTMIAMHCHRRDGQQQRAGIDRSIILENSKQILVDEKARRQSYGDILLEYVSNDRTGSPGWVEKLLLADYIAVAHTDTGKAWLLPVIQLQSAWARHKAEWTAKFLERNKGKPIIAPNPGYNTLSIGVSECDLFCAIGRCLRVDFAPEKKAA